LAKVFLIPRPNAIRSYLKNAPVGPSPNQYPLAKQTDKILVTSYFDSTINPFAAAVFDLLLGGRVQWLDLSAVERRRL
jgi:hypothetical protein